MSVVMPLRLECTYRLATIDSRLIGQYKAPCNHVIWALWYVYVYFLLVHIHAAAVHYDRALTTWKEVRTVDYEGGNAILLYLYCISSRVNTTNKIRNKTHDYCVCELCFYDVMRRVPIVKIWCSLGNWSFSILQTLKCVLFPWCVHICDEIHGQSTMRAKIYVHIISSVNPICIYPFRNSLKKQKPCTKV